MEKILKLTNSQYAINLMRTCTHLLLRQVTSPSHLAVHQRAKVHVHNFVPLHYHNRQNHIHLNYRANE